MTTMVTRTLGSSLPQLNLPGKKCHLRNKTASYTGIWNMAEWLNRMQILPTDLVPHFGLMICQGND